MLFDDQITDEFWTNESDEWYTPRWLLESLGEFDLDPACGPRCLTSTARVKYPCNGLDLPWQGRVWLNPPFSNVTAWSKRMIQHNNGIMLVFGRTDAKWMHNALKASGGFFMFLGRVQFYCPSRPSSRCPLGCVLLPFGEGNKEAILKAGFKGMWLSC